MFAEEEDGFGGGGGGHMHFSSTSFAYPTTSSQCWRCMLRPERIRENLTAIISRASHSMSDKVFQPGASRKIRFRVWEKKALSRKLPWVCSRVSSKGSRGSAGPVISSISS